MSEKGCTSKAHAEYDCMICWGVRGKRFVWKKWCPACQEKYQKYKSRITSEEGNGRQNRRKV